MTDPSTSLTRDDEAALIARVQRGDAAAYEPLVRMYQDRTFSLVLRMVSNYEDARDLTQDAFTRAYRGLGKFRAEASFHTWLFRIAVNAVISYRRRRGLARQHADPSSRGNGNPLAHVPDHNPGPAEQVEAGERRRAVQQAIAQIDPEFRDAIVLRDIQGMPYEDIVEVLSCPIGTVKSRIHRGRLALRALLAPIIAK